MKNKLLLLIYCLFLSISAFSQMSQKDSLILKLQHSKDSSENIITCMKLGLLSNAYGEYAKSIGYFKRSLKLSQETNDTAYITESLINLGHVYSNTGATNAAINYYLECLALSEKLKNETDLGSLYGSLGVEYTILGETDKAKAFLNKDLAINLKNNDKHSCAGTYNNFGIFYRKLNNYKEAIFYYKKGIQLCEEIGDDKTLMQTLNNIGYVHALEGDTLKALDDYNKSLAIAVKINDKFQQGLVLENIGNIYDGLKNKKMAIEYYEKALKITTETNDLLGLKEIHNYLAIIFEKSNQNEKALQHLKKYEIFRDSLEQINSDIERQRSEIKHEYDKEKLSLIKDQEKRDVLAKAESKKQELIIYFVSVSLLIVAVLLLFLYKRFKITNAQKTIIEDQKKVVEIKQKEIVDSINYAKRIQDSLFEDFDPGRKFFKDSFILHKPKDIVSGDFYWHSKKMTTEKISPNEFIVKEQFFIAVCDSTGHGVPGGFMSLLNIAYISEAINEKNILEPNKVFDHVRTRLINSISKNEQKDGFDGVLLRFEKRSCFKNKEIISTSLKLFYAAAHNAPIILRNGQLIELETDKMPVGYGERKENFSLFSYEILSNDIIYVYTDGYADQFGGQKGKKFMNKKLFELLTTQFNTPMAEQSKVINNEFIKWKGELEQVDDVCIIGIRL